MVRLLSPSDYTSMPWKNGGGRTTEIALYPPNATLDTFTWRVSLADVASDGPFSRFPGIDRTIVLMQGAGMRLQSGDGEVELRTPFAPHRFRGEEEIDCTLIGGAVRDFNAMFRRKAAHGAVTVVRGGSADIPRSDFVLIYAAIGKHECGIRGEVSQVLDAGHAIEVSASREGDAAPVSIRPTTPGAVALVVGIDVS